MILDFSSNFRGEGGLNFEIQFTKNWQSVSPHYIAPTP